MKIITVTAGSFMTNCYLLIDEGSGEAAVVDCAVLDDNFKYVLNKEGIKKLKYILVTHGHFDHVCGVKFLNDMFGGDICIHEADRFCLTDENKSLNSMAHFSVQEPVEPDVILHDGDRLMLGKTEFTVMHTPGHTPGSICFLTDDGVMFSGDTLFCGSIGRTDFPGGSMKIIMESLGRICALDGEYIIYPGHGEKTTLSDEKKYNRFLRAI